MTHKQLRAFLAVAQSLSFAQACQRLHLSQPALSLTIKNLENSLGGPLFSRSTRHVALTAEGETLLPLAQRLLAEWDNTQELLQQHFTLQQGRVAIAAMPSYAANCLPASIKTFRDSHPKINVTVHDVINEHVIEMVLDRRVELGVVLEPENLDGLTFTPLHHERFVVVLPPQSPLLGQTSLTWEQLRPEPFITLQRPSAVRHIIEQQVGPLTVAFESHQFTTVGRMVAAGLGVSIVPSICRQQMCELGAHCRELNSPLIEQRIGLIKATGAELSVAAQALAQTLMASSLRQHRPS